MAKKLAQLNEQEQALYTSLKFRLSDFLSEFKKKTIEWAESEYVRLLSIKYKDIIQMYGADSSKFGKIRSKASDRQWDKIHNLRYTTMADYIEMAKTAAEEHFEASLNKLIHRLVKKGLEMNSTKVLSVKMGVNLDILLEDDNGKKIHAYTIIAEGAVQRPHYRYLIK